MIGQHLKKEAGTQDSCVEVTLTLQDPCLNCSQTRLLFVEENELGLGDQGASQGNTHLHTAAQFTREML